MLYICYIQIMVLEVLVGTRLSSLLAHHPVKPVRPPGQLCGKIGDILGQEAHMSAVAGGTMRQARASTLRSRRTR